MKERIAFVIGAAALVLACGSMARANVLDPKADKTDVKLRADIGKQVAKYSFCLGKAATKCEKDGTLSTTECHLDTGVVDYEMTPGKATQKFHDAIAKCDQKVNFTKKGTDYTGIGCPGDCDSVAPGVQECADLNAFQATVTSNTLSTAPKLTLGTLAAYIDLGCSIALPMSVPTDQSRKDCVGNNAAILTKYAQGLFKCQGKCESDFKGKSGGGGASNGNECKAGAMDADPNFVACDTAALSKAGTTSPSVVNALLGPLRMAINNATLGFYDRFDPTGTPASSPCGNCGNNVREGAESCDGTDAGVCTMGCKPDCTCN